MALRDGRGRRCKAGKGTEKMKKAKIDGSPVPESAVEFELERLLKFYRENGMKAVELKRNLPVLREKALEQAIGAQLIRRRADSLDIPVSGAEIDASLAKVAAQAGGGDRLAKMLAEKGAGEAELRESLKNGIKMNKVVEQACSEVPEPTEKDISDFYAAHESEYAAEPRVFCRHILAKAESKEEKAAALEKIKAVRARLLDGADFAAEAKRHSDCPSGRDGGSLGWFSPGMMVPEFDKAAFEMAKGEISEPIETQFGWHVIYKQDEKPGGARELSEVHDEIKELLRHKARGRALDAFVAELRKTANVEYYDD